MELNKISGKNRIFVLRNFNTSILEYYYLLQQNNLCFLFGSRSDSSSFEILSIYNLSSSVIMRATKLSLLLFLLLFLINS